MVSSIALDGHTGDLRRISLEELQADKDEVLRNGALRPRRHLARASAKKRLQRPQGIEGVVRFSSLPQRSGSPRRDLESHCQAWQGAAVSHPGRQRVGTAAGTLQWRPHRPHACGWHCTGPRITMSTGALSRNFGSSFLQNSRHMLGGPARECTWYSCLNAICAWP